MTEIHVNRYSHSDGAHSSQTERRNDQATGLSLRSATIAYMLIVHAAVVHAQSVTNMLRTDAGVGEAAVPVLFREIDTPQIHTRPADAKVTRSRMVAVDMSRASAADRAAGDRVRFNLFDDVELDGAFERPVKVSADSTGWTGRIEGSELGRFSMVVVDGVLAANVYAPHGAVYQIRYVENDVYSVSQVDPSAYPPCGNGPEQSVGAGHQHNHPERQAPDTDAAPLEPDGSVAGHDSLEVDVLVVYTPLARSAAGGTAAMNALINLGVLETNDAYYNSGVHQHIDLVYKGEVDYEETGFIDEGLQRLTDKRDGFMDEVHDLRGIYGADLVSLVISDTSYCGIGWTLILPGVPVWNDYSFNVVRVDCFTGPDWSFAHELGHNMGCFHDRDNVDPEAHEPVDPWAYGHRFWGDSGEQWRTIMAYAPGTRIQHFSNPHATYDGQPTGVYEGREGEAFNARTINRTLTTIRDLRAIVTDIRWVQFGFSGFEFGTFANPFNTLTEGVTAIPVGGTVAIKSSSSSAAFFLDKSMILRAYDGHVRLGR